ncbi:hypothetical protein FOZ63_032117 [Perkinsus olseni]|uniref:Uncharacterized protein n=1 Tax=Perkinsus olseni TaxID=32597 RepID=A0A7J6QDN4_PEROL|nr:hypothetical protein FOZ62_028768 [Perkinsus olseni]KAF4733548.1 hypothetical protein FOZ63_032117 [Perkinsus olseni]
MSAMPSSSLEEYRRLIHEDHEALQRGRAALAESKRKAYAELKTEVLRKRAIDRARKPKNRPPWTYADAPGFRIGTDALVNSEPSGNFMKNPSRMGIYGAKGVPPPHERRRSKPFIKEFAYSAKGNDGGYFDASIGRLDEPIAGRHDSRPSGDRQKRSEKTARPPWSTQPFALDYFDKEMAKESISSKDELKGLRFAELAIAPDRTYDYSMPDFIAGDGKDGNKCLEDVEKWQRHHLRSGIRYWEKVEKDYRARVRERKKLLERLMGRTAVDASEGGRGKDEDDSDAGGTSAVEAVEVNLSNSGRTVTLLVAIQARSGWTKYSVECDKDETVGNLTDRLLERLGILPSETSILTTPSERRILMAVGDSRRWSGDDRCGDVLGEDAGCDNECFDWAKAA